MLGPVFLNVANPRGCLALATVECGFRGIRPRRPLVSVSVSVSGMNMSDAAISH